MRYGEEGSGSTVQITSGDTSGGMTTISGLTKETVYTVEVAAETSAGTGVYSDLHTIQTPDGESGGFNRHLYIALCNTALIDVYLTLNGDVIPNFGYVLISSVGSSDDTAILCHTNHPPDGANSGGDWHAPNGTRVNWNDVPGFTRDRGPMVVRLKRTTGTPAQGIYHCSISDDQYMIHIVYVGLYNMGGGIN